MAPGTCCNLVPDDKNTIDDMPTHIECELWATAYLFIFLYCNSQFSRAKSSGQKETDTRHRVRCQVRKPKQHDYKTITVYILVR